MIAQYDVALIGLGKMGISHLAIANATPGIRVSAIVDSSSMIGNLVGKYCAIPFFDTFERALDVPGLHGVIIATPTRLHEQMIRQAMARGLHIFCEKPMTLSASTSFGLASEAAERGLTCQVGYHNRFVGTFAEAKRLLDAGAIGRIRHVHAEAYGPVVLKPAARTWRSKATEGGGCLYDYAAHPINLMNWYIGTPLGCSGAQLERQWSDDVDDAVYANLAFASGMSGQVSVNWADETARKMSTRMTIWGDGGKITVDRQEIQVFIGAGGAPQAGYPSGWSIKYLTELSPHPAYYLRGEEYSLQIESFAQAIARSDGRAENDFASAAVTDHTLEMIRSASRGEARIALAEEPPAAPRAKLRPFWRATVQ